MITGTSVADRVNMLCQSLIRDGNPNKALEVVTIFSGLNESVDTEFPITKFSLFALFGGDETLLMQRENYRRLLYERHIKPYESL